MWGQYILLFVLLTVFRSNSISARVNFGAAQAAFPTNFGRDVDAAPPLNEERGWNIRNPKETSENPD